MRGFVCLWLCLSAATPAPAVGIDTGGFGWLERARTVAQQLDYQGEFILQRGLEVSHTRIVHIGSVKPEQQLLQSLDGEPREILRRGDEVRSYLPQQRRVTIEGMGKQATFPALLPLNRAQFERNYQIRMFASQQVAGHETVAIALDTRDRFHYSYRFWFARETGLLVRAQTISEDGEVVEQVGFRTLKIGDLSRAPLKATADVRRRWQVERAPISAADLSMWHVGWMPAGFTQVAMLSRRLSSRSGQSREVGQILYANGLSSVSIFIEPWSEEKSLSPLSLGGLNMVGKRHGKFWLTIVGDVPMMAVRRVADAIELAQISHK